MEDTIKNWIKQPTEWEKMFGNYIPNKGLASRIHKEPLEWNNKMINNTKHKGSEYTVFQIIYKITEKHIQRCSIDTSHWGN